MDFRILEWISGFQSGFLDFKVDFWISDWISADSVRDFFRGGPLDFCSWIFSGSGSGKLASYPDQGLGTRLTTTKDSILKIEATIALPKHDGENPKNSFSPFVLILIVVLHSVSLGKLSLSQDLH